MKQRIAKLFDYFDEHDLDAFIISKPENIRFFSGFTGDNCLLLVNRIKNKLLTDFRFIEQAKMQTSDFEIIRTNLQPVETLEQIINDLGLTHIGFESDFVIFDLYNKLSSNKQVHFLPQHIDSLRIIKDEQELSLIKKAVEISDSAFSHILTVLKPGISEIEIAAELEYHMRKLGSEKPAFDTIIASGVRGSLPHGVASAKKIEDGELVTMDFGAVYQGYHSDITRTVVIGKANAKQKELYHTVLTAQLTGVKHVKPGMKAFDVDFASREIISAAGYKECFGHGLGHGVGLMIHEEPRLSPANTSQILAEGMVVTVEPGVYLPGWGGIRIEDTVVVTADGVHILTASSKELIEIN